MVNSKDYYVKDEDELIFTGKKIRDFRDVCRLEGYKQAIEDVLNLPLREEVMDLRTDIRKLRYRGKI